MGSKLRSAGWLLGIAVAVLVVGEALRVYWIMPFPGSQRGETLGLAYAFHRWIWPLRLLAGGVVLWASLRLLKRGSWLVRGAVVAAAALYAFIAYQANGPMSAEVMFRQPTVLRFAAPQEATLSPEDVVIGVTLEDAAGRAQARAYPLQLIGYHHQVRDEVAGQAVMVTYCTVCRSGRVFSPVVEGAVDDFRLVGMDRFNALFEDARTGSWWRQATGEAVTGPLRGSRLEEIPSHQMSWQAWLALHPTSDVLEPDPRFADRYAQLEGYGDGTREGRLTGRNPASWEDKSWVVGVLAGGAARAFDWNELARERLIQDQVGTVPALVVLAADGTSFFAFDRRIGGTGEALSFEVDPADPTRLRDLTTGSTWSETGLALEGPLVGTRLATLPAYQEFWHSWRTFQPLTTARQSHTSNAASPGS